MHLVPIYFCYTVLHSINCRFQDDIFVSNHFKSVSLQKLWIKKQGKISCLMFSILLKLYKLEKSVPSLLNIVNLVLLLLGYEELHTYICICTVYLLITSHILLASYCPVITNLQCAAKPCSSHIYFFKNLSDLTLRNYVRQQSCTLSITCPFIYDNSVL